MAVFKREGRKPRHKNSDEVWLTLDGGFAKRDCTVIDLSTTGACIKVKDAASVPGVISVAFSKDVRKLTRCRLVWRKGSMIGVEFLAA